MVAVFALIDRQVRRPVIVLRDQSRRLSLLARSVANLLLVAHPAFLYPVLMRKLFTHNLV